MPSRPNGPSDHGRQKLISALESRGPVIPRDDGVYDWGERWRMIAGGLENARLREALESRGVGPPPHLRSLCLQHLGERAFAAFPLAWQDSGLQVGAPPAMSPSRIAFQDHWPYNPHRHRSDGVLRRPGASRERQR